MMRAAERSAAATGSATVAAAALQTTGKAEASATGAAVAAALQTHTGPTGAGRAMRALGEHLPSLETPLSACLPA